MDWAKNPSVQQSGLAKPSNQDQVEYASGKASRFLPGVSIVGQPAIDIRRGDKVKPVKPGPLVSSEQARQSQTFTPLTWPSAPEDAFADQSQTGLPFSFSSPQEKAIPSLYQTPTAMDSQDQTQSGSLLAHIANQICGGT